MPRPPLYPVLRFGAVAVLAGAVLLAPRAVQRRHVNAPPPTDAWVDTRWVRGVGEGAKMTGPRGPQQKRPPCLPRTEREVMGACWAPHVEKPPCPDGTFEAQGACFMPVIAPKREPTSVLP